MRRIGGRFRMMDDVRPRDPLPRKSLYDEAAGVSYWARWLVVILALGVGFLQDRAVTPTTWVLVGVAGYNTVLQVLAGMRRDPSLSTGLGLSLHPPEFQGRVSGAVEALLDGFLSL